MNTLQESRTLTSHWDPFAHLFQGELDGLKFRFQCLDLIGSIGFMSSLDELRKDPPTRVPTELHEPKKELGSAPGVGQRGENPTDTDEYVQQRQVETRRPN